MQFYFFYQLAEVPILKYVCKPCWKPIYAFHELYIKIEEIQNSFEEYEEQEIEQVEGDFIDAVDEEIVDLEQELEATEIPKAAIEKVEEINEEKYETTEIDDIKCEIDITDIIEQTIECVPEHTIEQTIDVETNNEFEEEITVEENEKVKSNDESKYTGNTSDGNTSDASRKQSESIRAKRLKQHELFKEHFAMICDICQTHCEDWFTLMTHFKREHDPTQGYVICCEKRFYSPGKLLEHIEWHRNPDQFKCKVCEKIFNCRDTLNRHMAIHNRNENDAIRCELCGKSYFSVKGLKAHMDGKHREKNIPCDICGRM